MPGLFIVLFGPASFVDSDAFMPSDSQNVSVLPRGNLTTAKKRCE